MKIILAGIITFSVIGLTPANATPPNQSSQIIVPISYSSGSAGINP